MKNLSGLIITFCTAIFLTGFAIGTKAFGTIHGGSGIAAGNGYLNLGTNIILYTYSGYGIGYFYNGQERGDPIVYFGDVISPSPCYSGFDGYQGVGVIQEFTSASNHVFTDQYPYIVFGARNSNCYQGILLFYQNGRYGGIEPVFIDDAHEYLYYKWWYDDSGASDFSHWVAPTGDRDSDGIYDNEDNCLDKPNGPSLGACYAWSGMEGGTTCRRDIDCGGLPKSCSMNQEDVDLDTVGDVCDNCPDHPNGPGSGICTAGDIGQTCAENADCNCGGMCKNFVCIGPCPVTYGQPCFGPYDCNVAGICYQDNQLDSYPTQGNGIGDACDCEGNFNCSQDQDVDGTDAALLKVHFGRGGFNSPCIAGNPCNGDFSCDGDVDGTDAALFKSDFGRSPFQNPCPACNVGVEWCQYQ